VTRRRALAVVAAAFAVSVWSAWMATPSEADPVPAQANGSGNCNQPTTTCYPECAWEWGGQAEITPKPCPYSQAVQAQASTVAIGNLPATQAVHVDNTSASRIPVSAVCESSVPCVSNGDASVVTVSNDAQHPVPVGGVGPAWTAIVMVFGIGTVAGLLVVR
jgi:hypothetical protein